MTSRADTLQRRGLNSVNRLTTCKTWFELAKVSTGVALVLWGGPGINSLAAFVFASHLYLLRNSMARANRGCDVWGRENEKIAVCVLCVDARARACLVRVGPVANHCRNCAGRCSG